MQSIIDGIVEDLKQECIQFFSRIPSINQAAEKASATLNRRPLAFFLYL